MRHNQNTLIRSCRLDSCLISSDQETQAWESAVDSHKNFERFTRDNLKKFSELFGSEDDPDSYLTSPIYYAFTGRKGLWIYSKGDSFIPLCWHPNIPGQILVFPSRGSSHADLLQRLLDCLPVPPKGVRLARVKTNYCVVTQKKSFLLPSGQSAVFAPVIERVLDWKYPVRVLSTEAISRLQGAAFHRVRNHIRNVQKHRIDIKRLCDVSPVLLDDFISIWAKMRACDMAEARELTTLYRELLSLYRELLSLANGSLFSTDGFVTCVDGKIEGVTLWDISNAITPTANRFVNLCNTNKCRGLADFIMHQTAKRLSAQGIKYINIGGAETESLDRFKCKFMPAFSLELHSVDVIFHDSSDEKPFPNLETRLGDNSIFVLNGRTFATENATERVEIT